MSQVSSTPTRACWCHLVDKCFLVGVMTIHVYRKIEREEIKERALKARIYARDIVSN